MKENVSGCFLWTQCIVCATFTSCTIHKQRVASTDSGMWICGEGQSADLERDPSPATPQRGMSYGLRRMVPPKNSHVRRTFIDRRLCCDKCGVYRGRQCVCVYWNDLCIINSSTNRPRSNKPGLVHYSMQDIASSSCARRALGLGQVLDTPAH